MARESRELVSLLRGDLQLARALAVLQSHAEAVHVEIYDRGGEEGEHLAEDEAAHDCDS